MEIFPAHIRFDDSGGEHIQSVEEHCHGASKHAADALLGVGLSSCGRLEGLLHDLGKYTVDYSEYLTRSAHGEKIPRGSVIHTFQAVKLLLEKYHSPPGSARAIAAELIAVAVGSHHGYFDCVDTEGRNGFLHRVNAANIYYETARDNFFRCCCPEKELDRFFEDAAAEIEDVLVRIMKMANDAAVDDEQYYVETTFYSGLLVRLLLSAVIEGDRRDTAEFMLGQTEEKPVTPNRDLWNACLQNVEEKLNDFANVSDIDQARRNISNQCRTAADLPGGVFRLNVPTGGGKTLSSLRFALAHAAQYDKSRIIFTSPLLSILDQNAKEIRRYLQNDDIILEHHSNVVQDEETDGETLSQRELLAESWEAPVIITTLVQLLNTLFSGKTTAIRRFHALCRSVIVIDEVQTVPSNMLSLFSLAVNFLAEICGATVVLCSATQPTLEELKHPLYGGIRDIVPYKKELWDAFRRTEIIYAGTMSLAELAAYAGDVLDRAGSLLIVCNKKAEAEELFRIISRDGCDVYFLSAAMCVAHRQKALDAIKTALKPGNPRKVICVSTQVIEAGVDISFGSVIRLQAGMDSVVQAAGRCNRNHESQTLGAVGIVNCAGERLTHLDDIQHGKDATAALIAEYKIAPERYGHSLDSASAIEYYYRSFYRSMPDQHQDYPVEIDGRKDTLLSLLSRNDKLSEAGIDCGYYFQQAFRTAGKCFAVFDSDTTDVIVPYGEGESIVAKLQSEQAARSLDYTRQLLQRAKPYTVSLFPYQFEKLETEGSIIPLNGGAYALIGHYDKNTGFTAQDTEAAFLGV